MSAETRSYDLHATHYVQVSSGHRTVLIHAHEAPQVRMHVGQSLPAADTEHWFPVNMYQPFELFGLSSGDNIYLRADAASSNNRENRDAVAEVIRA